MSSLSPIWFKSLLLFSITDEGNKTEKIWEIEVVQNVHQFSKFS